MGRWLEALCEKEKNAKSTGDHPPKTPETTHAEVLGVLGVPDQRVFVKNSETAISTPSDILEGFGGFGGSSSEQIEDFSSKKIEESACTRTDETPKTGFGGFGWSQNAKIGENFSSENVDSGPDVDGQPGEEKNAKTPISGTAKTPKTCSVSFVSSPSSQIQDFFAPDPAGTWDAEDWQVAFEERAAIFEYDGGWSREAAEQFARQWLDEQRSIKRSTQ